MPAIRRPSLLLAVAIAAAVAGCNRESAPTVAALGSADANRAAAVTSQPAWLRDRLPAHSVGYARIPTPWGLLSAPNGRALDPALASAAHLKVIADVRAAIGKDRVLADVGATPFVLLAFDDLAAPLELAIVDAGDMANPTSSVFVTTELRLADVAAVNARLAAVGGTTPLLKAPLDATGKGEASANGYLHFDATTRRLHGLFGMTASASGLQQIVDQLGSTRSHPLQAIEQEMDRSGQGLFFWMSLKGINAMAAAQWPSALPGTLSRDFIDTSQSVALGWGTVGQRGRLQVRLQAPQARFLSYFAPTSFDAALKSAGKPLWAATVALPTATQLLTLEKNLDQDFGAGSADSYRKAMDAMKSHAGFDLMELLGVVGPELIAFEDAAGSYWALRVNDRKAFQSRLDAIGAKLGWRQNALQVGKANVHHVHMPGIAPPLPEGAAADAAQSRRLLAMQQLATRFGNHLYWSVDGDYLLFASVPQALADRAAARLDTDIGDWLRDSQSHDPAQTLFGVTVATRNMQRTMYYGYLSLLQLLADLVAVPVDLAGLPSASELQLPVDGATGLALEASRDRIGLSISYEQSPLETLAGGGGVGMLAGGAIVAAIAVPAYQDYSVRAQVSQVITSMQPLQAAITAYRAEHGRWPDSDDDLDLPEPGDALKYLSNYYVEQGALVLTFGDEADAKLGDGVLVIEPIESAGVPGWRCGLATVDDEIGQPADIEAITTLDPKYLPATCR